MDPVAFALGQVDVNGAGDAAAITHSEVAGQIVHVVDELRGYRGGESTKVVELRNLGAGHEHPGVSGLASSNDDEATVEGRAPYAGQVLHGAQGVAHRPRHLDELFCAQGPARDLLPVEVGAND